MTSIGINQRRKFQIDPSTYPKQQRYAVSNNCAVEVLHKVSGVLNALMLRELEIATSFIAPLTKPKGQHNDGVHESRTWRVIHAIELISLVPLTIAALLASVGMVLRSICCIFQPPICILVNPSVSPPPYTGEIRIECFNVAGAPDYIGLMNGFPCNVQKRAHQDVQAIKQLIKNGQKPHVICLQECFDADVKRIICEGLHSEYRFILHNIAPNGIGFDSGMIILTVFDVVRDIEYWPFKNISGIGEVANKGLAGLPLKLEEGKFARIYNAHFQANRGPQYAAIRERQLDNVQAWVRYDCDGKPPLQGVIITGDFNMTNVDERGNKIEEYDKTTRKLHTHDTYRDPTREREETGSSLSSWYERYGPKEGAWGSKGWAQKTAPGTMFDRCLVDKTRPLKACTAEIRQFEFIATGILTSGLSDHTALSIKVYSTNTTITRS